MGKTITEKTAQKLRHRFAIAARLVVAIMTAVSMSCALSVGLIVFGQSQTIGVEYSTSLHDDVDAFSAMTSTILIMEFDAVNNTETLVNTAKCTYGEVITLDTIPTKTNYVFNGCWTEKPTNCLPNKEWGEQYIDADGVGIKPVLQDSPTVLYVNWVGVEVAVKFFVGGYRVDIMVNGEALEAQTGYFGCALKDCFDFPTNEELGLPKENIYIWYNNQKFTGNRITPDSVINELTTQGIFKLYANEVESFEFTVTLTMEDDAELDEEHPQPKAWQRVGEKVFMQVYKYEKGKSPEDMGTLPTPKRAGYTYTGKWKEKNGNEVTNMTAITRDFNCTPCWQANNYTVKIGSDSENSQDISMTFGSTTTDTVKVPASEEHYKFDGYYSEKDVQYFDSTGKNVRAWDIAGSATLTAKFSPIEYSIKYELNGGVLAGENPTQYNIEDETITLIAPTKAGYTFVGWITAEDDVPQLEVIIPAGSYGDRTYIAVFKLNAQDEESLSITIECTNFVGQCIMVYLFDESGNSISSVCMQTDKYTFVPQTSASEFYIKIKAIVPNKLNFTLPTNDCTQTTLGSTTTIFLPTEESKNYTISFTATNINIINSTFV